MTTKLNEIQFAEFREIANGHLQKKEFAAAMEYYEKCLRITRKATSLDNMAIYVNKIACLLSLEKYNQVVAECNDAFRLIKNFKNRNEGNKDKEIQKRIDSMELRVAVRKATAQAKLGKDTEAIQEYEKALKIEPNNATVKKELEILR